MRRGEAGKDLKLDTQATAQQQYADELQVLHRRIARLEQVEDALRESEERYRVLAESAEEGTGRNREEQGDGGWLSNYNL